MSATSPSILRSSSSMSGMRHIRSPVRSADEEAIGKAIVGGEESGRAVTEGDDCRPGQGREIDELGRAAAGRIDKSVGKNESALRVGREDLHCDPIHPSDHITRPERRPGDHVFGSANRRLHRHRAFQIAQSRHGAEDGGSARHVPFHVQHSLVRFDRVATGVERDCLADQTDDPRSCRYRPRAGNATG